MISLFLKNKYLINKACLWAGFLFYICIGTGCKTKNKSQNITEKISNYSIDTGLINSSLKKAKSFDSKHFDSMQYFSTIALEKSIRIHYKEGEANALFFQSNYSRRKGNYPTALQLALKAANLYDSLKKN